MKRRGRKQRRFPACSNPDQFTHISSPIEINNITSMSKTSRIWPCIVSSCNTREIGKPHKIGNMCHCFWHSCRYITGSYRIAVCINAIGFPQKYFTPVWSWTEDDSNDLTVRFLWWWKGNTPHRSQNEDDIYQMVNHQVNHRLCTSVASFIWGSQSSLQK